MGICIPTLEEMYIDSCRRHEVLPNAAILSGFFKAEVTKSCNELCSMDIVLDRLKDIDFPSLLDVCVAIDNSEIEAVDVRNESSCVLNGECALSLMRAFDQKLRVVDLHDSSFGKDFLRYVIVCAVVMMSNAVERQYTIYIHQRGLKQFLEDKVRETFLPIVLKKGRRRFILSCLTNCFLCHFHVSQKLWERHSSHNLFGFMSSVFKTSKLPNFLRLLSISKFHRFYMHDLLHIADLRFVRRELSQRGLACQVLNLRSSHFRKLNMGGKFMQIHTLNLDFSTSLSSFREDCFTCMPNLVSLSMCETGISNLWTTIAALSKLSSLVELQFQKWVCCSDNGSASSSHGKFDHQPYFGQLNGSTNIGALSADVGELTDLTSSPEGTLRNMFSFNNLVINQQVQNMEDSSDDSEMDFSSHRQDFDYMEVSSSASSGWNRHVNLQNEVSFGMLFNQKEESLSGSLGRHVTDLALKYISCHPSPICFEKHYREFMIASLPQLKVLDNIAVRNIDKERAAVTFSQYFEYLPYKRKHKESIVNILHKREIKEKRSHSWSANQKASYSCGNSPYFYTRSLCAAKVGSSAWPFFHSLSLSSCDVGDGNINFRPRQFEYHPSISSLMVFGTLDGEVVVINHESEKIVRHIPSLGAMNSVLGLCWLKKYPSKLIAGSDNGSLKLYDIEHMPPTFTVMFSGAGSVTFDDFDQLTSVHVNSTDELFLASGYSKNVALYDINYGKRIQVFTDMHREHINVVKFSNHSPSVFATSSFDQDVKLWDLRQKPIQPCHTTSSSRGNVMVCFSPDDHYLLASAVDNEVRQILTVDGRLHMAFEIPSTGSSQNYTRSYYMNGRDYIVSGSCDEHVVRVCCAQTGKRLRDISLEGRCSGASMYVQSLRGDPFRDFNMSILAAYMRPSSKYEIVKVNLLASCDQAKESSYNRHSHPSNSMGG